MCTNSHFSLWEASGPEPGAAVAGAGRGTDSSPLALAPGCTYEEAAPTRRLHEGRETGRTVAPRRPRGGSWQRPGQPQCQLLWALLRAQGHLGSTRRVCRRPGEDKSQAAGALAAALGRAQSSLASWADEAPAVTQGPAPGREPCAWA